MAKHHAVGIDVGASELVMAWRESGGVLHRGTFANTSSGHRQIIRLLCGGDSTAQVGLESTGIYSLGLSLALHDTRGIEVMVINPRAAKDFARASMTRAKTDAVDALSLLEFVERMPFVSWQPPRPSVLRLRGLTRRLNQLKWEMQRETNRGKQAAFAGDRFLRHDIELNLRHLKRRIEVLDQACLEVIEADVELYASYLQMTSVPGIARRTAPVLLAELSVLPPDMQAKQWVAHAGLDPRTYESGTSIQKPRRISKVGNRYLRQALYMPALVAIRHDEHIRAFYERLVARGKKPKQAIVAVMRKLLLAIHGMQQTGTHFDSAKFCGRISHVA